MDVIESCNQESRLGLRIERRMSRVLIDGLPQTEYNRNGPPYWIANSFRQGNMI
jgi:hypothetical protein